MYLRCIGLWITVHIGTCFYSISLIETFPGQYLFIIIAICQYYCLLFSISHLLFHLGSGVYYFSLKTVPSFLKLNQYKFNLTWREWLPPRQSLCYSLLLAVPDAARFCVLWQNHPGWSLHMATNTEFSQSCWFSLSAKTSPLTERLKSLLGTRVHTL